ncbi:hypothetical protein V5O48_014138 [Marasmius crinis-equi]|uniref:WD40 repeat-like protein n=1 Tax=Marasmius crinis-equi TaxID=585013 RepID=A0ABR3EY59_9AGAR
MLQLFSPRYYPHATFTGPKDTVLSVSISVDSRYLAAAGYNGVSVWDIETGELVSLPSKYSPATEQKFMQSTSAWVYFESIKKHMLLLGGMKGDLVSWTIRDPKKGFEHSKRALTSNCASQITSMQVHESSISSGGCARVAICCPDDHSVSVWKLAGSNGEFEQVYSISLEPNFRPKEVRFDKEKNIHAFDQCGTIRHLHKKTGRLLWEKKTTIKRMNNVALDPGNNRLFVHTGADIQILDFSNLKHQKTIELSAPVVVPYPKQLAFAEDHARMISGTDSGHAAIYRIDNGVMTLDQKLEYPNGGLVQVVAYSRGSRWDYVAIAGSTQERASDTILFRKKHTSSLQNLKLSKWFTYFTSWKLITAALALFSMWLAHTYRSPILKLYQSTPGLASFHSASDAHRSVPTTTLESTSNSGTPSPTSFSDIPAPTSSVPPVAFRQPYLDEYHDILRRLQARLDELDEPRRIHAGRSARDDFTDSRPIGSRRGASQSSRDTDGEDTYSDAQTAFHNPSTQARDTHSAGGREPGAAPRVDAEAKHYSLRPPASFEASSDNQVPTVQASNPEPPQRKSHAGGRDHYGTGSFGHRGAAKEFNEERTHLKVAELEVSTDVRDGTGASD